MKHKISFNWRRDDNKPIRGEHKNELRALAKERIQEMTSQGFTSGELRASLPSTNSPEHEINYSGWWNKETLENDNSNRHSTTNR